MTSGATTHRKTKILLVFAASLFLSSSSIQGPLFHPVAAAAATDPPSSVTVLAGCSYFSSLRFTNNVPQYVTANPQYQPLNFTKSTCTNGFGTFNIPTPAQVPPIFFLRGTTITIRAVCSTNPECLLALGRNPMAVHDPTSAGVPNLEINLINGTAISITIPPNAGIGRYHFSGNIQVSTAQFSPCQLLDPFSAWFWVIYNASPGSSDAAVNGLNATAYSRFVLGQTDLAYFGQSTTMSATYSVKTVTNRYMGGSITFTLGPQKAIVYLAAMKLVDGAMAWTSASNSVASIAQGASNGLPSGWPVPSGKTLLYDVPLLLSRLANPATAGTVCGQCMVYGAIGDALSRSIGVPTRMATTINSIAVGVMPANKATAPPGAWTWNFHVWDEVWVNPVTSMAWSAFDPSRGNAFGTTPISPIGPIPTNAMPAGSTPGTSFALRFATGMLPGAAAGTCPCASTAFVTSASGARGTDTAAYRSPLPDPDPPTGSVTVTFDKAAYTVGDDVFATVTVTNPYPYPVSASAEVSLNAIDFGDINIDGPWPLGTAASVISVPASGMASQTFEFTPAEYQTSGDFVVLAEVNLGASTVSGFNYTSVTSGLSLQVSAPSTVSTGADFSATIQVTNDLASTITDPTIALLLPTDVTPLDPADFTIPSISGGATDTFVIQVQAGAVPEFYAIWAEANTTAGGISFSPPIGVNATDPPMSALRLNPETTPAISQQHVLQVSTSSATTCSTTPPEVPEFSGGTSAVAVAAVSFLLVATGWAFFRRTRSGGVASRRQPNSLPDDDLGWTTERP